MSDQQPETLSDLPVQRPKKVRKATWLISFTDVISLMLAFFVMLFAMKQPDQEKWSSISSVLQGEYGRVFAGDAFSGPAEIGKVEIKQHTDKVFTLNYLEALLKRFLEKERVTSVTIKRLDDVLVFSVLGTDIENLNSVTARSMMVLGRTLNRVGNKVEILTVQFAQAGQASSLEIGKQASKILQNSGYNHDILVSGYRPNEETAELGSLSAGTVNVMIYSQRAR